jgi:predicted permease
MVPSGFAVGDVVYRTLLVAMPPDVRREVGEDMVQMFRDHRRGLAGHPLRLLSLWVEAIVDLLAHATAERSRRWRGSVFSMRLPMHGVFADLRQGFRLLTRQRGFTAIAVVVLALGIGANTAVFTLINGMLLKPLAGHPAGELAQLFSKDTSKPDTFRAFSYPNYADLRARTDVFASLTAHSFSLAGMEDGSGRSPRQVFIDIATANFFDTFGAPLALGRTFTPDEERPGADLPVAVLSHAAWQRLGGSQDILGRTIRLNARKFTVVGVAVKGFGGSMAMVTPELWVPTGVYDTISNDFARAGLTGTSASRQHHTFVLVAQLKPGATIASMAPALDVAAQQMAAAYPVDNKDQALLMTPLSRLSLSTSPNREGPVTAFSASLLAMSGLVLLIASFNLANMLLARGAARRREFAVRTAIGGGRWRLTRQLLVEGFVLALAGGVGGLLLASWATQALIASLAGFSPVTISFDAMPDRRVLAATIGFCALATMVFSLGPALRVARADAVPGLTDRPGDLGGGRRRLRVQHVLVMGQLALSLVMLTVAGLFVRGARQATHLDPGFTFERGVMVHVNASRGDLERTAVRPTYARLLDDLRARPDVAAAGAASIMPFGDIEEGASVQKAGATLPDKDPGLVGAIFTVASSSYFDALGLRVVAGRDFTALEERADAGEQLAVIDQPLARKLFGTANPVGQPIQYNLRSVQAPVVMRVIGVVPGVRHDVFDTEPVPHLYVPLGQNSRTDLFVHIRTSAPTAEAEAALMPSIRRTVEAVSTALPVLSVETRAMYRDHNLAFSIVNLGSAIFFVFGTVALVLAMVGVYGVKAYVVSNRTREIGIRIALGAPATNVVWTVVREGFTLSVAGLAIGLVLSIGAGFGMKALTFGGRGADVVAVGGAMLVLAVSALVASWIPARRATRIEPTVALRSE